jgi:UDP-2,3-diacylglucosamine hydrolase
MANSVYFVSDTHFGAGDPADQGQRVRRFCAWLDQLEDASHLYLVGDIFDFWLDYPTFMPKTHLEILFSLRRLMDRRVEIVFIGGNHDVWCADYFSQSLGITTMESGTVVEHQGVRLLLDHGDGLLTGDRFYRLFRSVVRNPVLVFLAKAIHPELLHRLALFISRRSRSADDSAREDILELIRRYGNDHSHKDVDHLVTGHVHTPCQIEFDGWTFTNLGDWVVNYTAGRLLDGQLEVIEVLSEYALDNEIRGAKPD